ncbi:VOC family protein [Spirosoma sp. BT702]|uniref:VOC family protein n=1 Tax=Spirosoma profusum TaxID=2771354 RepID=A0A926Y2R4_9BACT|nr:glyoxalase superfamily protein [Spirosoma profusum]MBD2701180.1 VOC family protein [Spirosoma profusum]
MKLEKTTPVLYVSDISRSLSYYTHILGFDEKWEWESPPTFGGVEKDGVEIFFSSDGHSRSWVCLIVDDVDAYYKTIVSKGAIIIAPPQSQSWNIREMYVKDPDGNLLSFGHRLDCEPNE